MFILKRQDVEISNVQHPSRNQSLPILSYQGQTFRLLQWFNASQEEDAKALWRDLTDNQGKACVLLEEPDRYSVWGKVRLDQLADEADGSAAPPAYVQACLLLVQAVYLDIEDLLGTKQVNLFQKDMADMFQKWKFPQAESPELVKNLLMTDPLKTLQIPAWQDHHLNKLLEELHQLGKKYFGNTSFADRAMEALQDLSDADQARFTDWLKQSPNAKLWK
jgi:hypothetical protein